MQTERNAAAERALKERDRLYRNYRLLKRQHRQNLYAEHPQGWRLKQFALQLNRFRMPDAAAFLTYVTEENRSWLCLAEPELRAEALSLIDERIQRIRQREGLLPLDDPIPSLAGRGEDAGTPDQDDDVWQLAKRELA